jgi:hypothetical protein
VSLMHGRREGGKEKGSLAGPHGVRRRPRLGICSGWSCYGGGCLAPPPAFSRGLSEEARGGGAGPGDLRLAKAEQAQA